MIIIITMIPFFDLLINLYTSYWDYFMHMESYNNVIPPYVYHPAMAALLSGSSVGHLAQMLLIWILPLYLLLLYSGSVITEKNSGYLNIMYTKVGKKRYVKTKLLSAFLIGSCTLFFSLLLNFALSCILFSQGTSFSGLEEIVDYMPPFFGFSIEHPYIVYIFYILSTSICAGIICMFSASAAFILKSNWALFPVVFFLWILLVINPYSITYIMQPFIEFGLKYMAVSSGLILVVALAGIIIAHIYIRRKDALQ